MCRSMNPWSIKWVKKIFLNYFFKRSIFKLSPQTLLEISLRDKS